MRSASGSGDTRTIQELFIDDNTYLLFQASADPSYGYSKQNPVEVGGAKEMEGPLNERRFLNGLLGASGEQVSHYRVGSCCPFKTPNAFIGNEGLLDVYRVNIAGSSDTLTLYLNMYDKGNLEIPVGFTAKKR